MKKLAGVLAIQGDFQAHIAVLDEIGMMHREVRCRSDLDGITHLIIPGGESTTIRRVAGADGFWGELANFSGAVMGTCMGSILMAKEIISPDADGWGMLDITVKRIAYGRQINSFTSIGRVGFADGPFEMVFIRAPRIIRIGDGVKPIAWLDDEITGVLAGNKMALTFHPELSGSSKAHEYFMSL